MGQCCSNEQGVQGYVKSSKERIAASGNLDDQKALTEIHAPSHLVFQSKKF